MNGWIVQFYVFETLLQIVWLLLFNILTLELNDTNSDSSKYYFHNVMPAQIVTVGMECESRSHCDEQHVSQFT